MAKTATIIMITTFLMMATACKSNSGSDKNTTSSILKEDTPGARVLAYQSGLNHNSKSAHRFYSTRVLTLIENGGEPRERIAGYEITVSPYGLKILKEEYKETSNTSEVVARLNDGPGLIFRYNLIKEDGAWYIDEVFMEDELVKGFEAQPQGVPTVISTKP